jgi:membrane protein DedA with SNARE-associated domain
MISLLLSGQHWLERVAGSVNYLLSSIGGLGVLLLAMGDSSFLTLPEGNDLLIVVLSAGKSWGQMAYYVVMTIIGSVIGCLILYSIGRRGGNPMLRRRFSPKSIDRAEKLFGRYGILSVVISSILPPPTPFKIFVLSAGVFRFKTPEFFTAVLIGRTIRYSIWGILAVLYGNSVKAYMQQNLNLFGIILCACFVLAIGFSIFFYFRRAKASETEP